MAVSFAIGTQVLSDKELLQLCPSHELIEDFTDGAVTHPAKSRTLVIAMVLSNSGQVLLIDHREESVLLTEWWSKVQSLCIGRTPIFSLNCTTFDLPYLVWRSWSLGVDVPGSVISWMGHKCIWSPLFVDMSVAASLGTDKLHDLSDVAVVLGMGQPDDVHTRETFAALWKRDQARAIKWLVNNARQPLEWASRMGMI